jgi:hypothetical protein
MKWRMIRLSFLVLAWFVSCLRVSRCAITEWNQHHTEEESQKMKNCMRIEMMIAIIVLLIVSAVYVPARNAQTSEQRVTKVRIDMRDIYGALFVTIAGTEKKVTDQAHYTLSPASPL